MGTHGEDDKTNNKNTSVAETYKRLLPTFPTEVMFADSQFNTVLPLPGKMTMLVLAPSLL